MKIATITAAALLLLCTPPASADDTITVSGCESIPIFGLSPSVRKICDSPIEADGSWLRARMFWQPQFQHSSCGGVYYPGGQCPPGASYDVIPEYTGPWEVYRVTAETIPPGEPGHLDNPIRCTTEAIRCV